MKPIKLFVPVIFLSLTMAACGNDYEDQGNSTPIDSTNLTGAAPATYGTDSMNYPVHEGSTDTGMRANTMSHEDSMRVNPNQ